ncbi:MAG: hypothetical protein Q8K61_08815 [Gallionella sp.]|nr:hypothetical protein [Gallionella sp.]
MDTPILPRFLHRFLALGGDHRAKVEEINAAEAHLQKLQTRINRDHKHDFHLVMLHFVTTNEFAALVESSQRDLKACEIGYTRRHFTNLLHKCAARGGVHK